MKKAKSKKLPVKKIKTQPKRISSNQTLLGNVLSFGWLKKLIENKADFFIENSLNAVPFCATFHWVVPSDK